MKKFRVMKYPSNSDICQLTEIPWSVLAPYESRAMKNHSQSLNTLHNRGGCAPDELVAILEDRAWTQMDPKFACQRLAAIVEKELKTQEQIAKLKSDLSTAIGIINNNIVYINSAWNLSPSGKEYMAQVNKFIDTVEKDLEKS